MHLGVEKAGAQNQRGANRLKMILRLKRPPRSENHPETALISLVELNLCGSLPVYFVGWSVSF
jgi:hypothetical protein